LTPETLLFPDWPGEGDADADPPPAAAPLPNGPPRPRYAQRRQGEMRTDSLDQLLPPEPPVRFVWAYVEHLDLSVLRQAIQAVAGCAANTWPISGCAAACR